MTNWWARPGPRGQLLLCFAGIDVLFGVGILAAGPQVRASPTYAFPAQILPLHAWALIWLLVAVLLIAAAFVPRLDTTAFAAAIGIKAVWGLLMLGGWLAGDIPRGYVAMGIWVGLAGVVKVCSRHLPAREGG
jgi:hypothetical protein